MNLAAAFRFSCPTWCRSVVLLSTLFTLASTSETSAKPGDPATKAEATADDDPFAPSKTEAPTPAVPPAKQPSPRDLPWVKKKLKSDALPLVRPPANVREIMERYDIGDSQLEGFFSNQPLSVSEEEVLVRILFRLPRIGIDSIEKWRKPELQLDQLFADPSAHRLEVVPLKGRLIGIEKKDVTPELAVRLEFKHYYLAKINLEDRYEALVALRRVPEYWTTKADLNEPVSLDGIFIKSCADPTADKPQLIFVSRRIRWQPDQPIPELYIGADQLRLAELGFDLSLLEDLRTSNKQPIGDLDREPQYQLLDLVGKAPSNKLVSDPRKTIDIVELLKAPEQHQGELVSVYGFARRITKVVVDDPDIRARFGIDHYYEIDVAVDLKEKTIRFVDDPKAKPTEKNKEAATGGEKKGEPKPGEDAIFNNDYPVTVVVRELPPSLKPADAIRELIHVDGVFMKTWAYRNNYMAQFGNKLQVAPLIVAKRPIRVVPERVHNWVSDVLVGLAMAIAALVIGAVFYWFRTADKQIRQTLDGLDERASPPSFKGLENAPTKPDFAALEQLPPPPGT